MKKVFCIIVIISILLGCATQSIKQIEPLYTDDKIGQDQGHKMVKPKI